MRDVLDDHECIEDIDPSLILVDIDEYPESEALLEDFGCTTPVIALTRGKGHASWGSLLCDRGAALIMTIPELPAANVGAWRPLVVAVEKILQLDFFGLDKYLGGYGIQSHRQMIYSANHREDALHALGENLRALQYPTRLIHSIHNGADELITNAVYNAPRDARGMPMYDSVNRTNKIMLRPSEAAEFRFASDGQHFGISVRDHFGALDFEELRFGMQRCLRSGAEVRQGTGGAGIGLFMLARSCRSLIFNVRRSRATEVIALWTARPRENEDCSIYFFDEERYQEMARLRESEATLPGHVLAADTDINISALRDPPTWEETKPMHRSRSSYATGVDFESNWMN